MPSGQRHGIPGAFPALKADPYVEVEGDAGAVIVIVLKGRAGMPSFAAALDDAQLALVLSQICQSWGNQAAVVSEQQVQAVRSCANAGDVIRCEQPTNVH